MLIVITEGIIHFTRTLSYDDIAHKLIILLFIFIFSHEQLTEEWSTDPGPPWSDKVVAWWEVIKYPTGSVRDL